MKQSTIAMTAVLMTALIMLAGCGTGQAATPVEARPIRIGVSMPLTGEAASLGEGAVAGIEYAIKEINAAGGIDGRTVEAIYEDDKCSKDGLTTLTKLVTVDNVDAIIGPFCSAAAGPGLPMVQRSGTPAIIFGSAPHLTTIGDYIFRIYPSDSFAGKFMADYTFTTMGKTKAAIVYVKNDWGQGIHDVFTQRYEELGGTIVFDDSLLQDQQDTRTVLAKIRDAEPDVIVAPLYPAVALTFIKQAKELGIDAPIFGGDAMETDEVIKSGIADGVMYTVAAINNPDGFKAKVEVATGMQTNLGTPLGYDAINVFADIMRKVGTDKQAVRDALAEERYNGISSTVIEFDENGDLKAASYDVKLIKDGKAVPVIG